MNRRQNPRPLPLNEERIDRFMVELMSQLKTWLLKERLRHSPIQGPRWILTVPSAPVTDPLVRSVRTGEPRVVEVQLWSEPSRPFDKMVHRALLSYFGEKNPTQVFVVSIFLNGVHSPVDIEKNLARVEVGIRDKLEHELRHVSQETAHGPTSTLPKESNDALSFRIYINDPAELEARIGNLVSEVKRAAKHPDVERTIRKRCYDSRLALFTSLLNGIDTWHRMLEAGLTEKNERKVRRAVYTAVEPTLSQIIERKGEPVRLPNPRPIPLDEMALREDAEAIVESLHAYAEEEIAVRASDGMNPDWPLAGARAHIIRHEMKAKAITGDRRIDRTVVGIQLIDGKGSKKLVVSGAAHIWRGPSGEPEGRIVVRVNAAMTPGELASATSGGQFSILFGDLLSLLRHEMTHVGDWKSETGPSYSKSEGVVDDWKDYYNDPLEVRSFMREITDDVKHYVSMNVETARPKELVQKALDSSSRWQQMVPHLTPANEKLLLQAAYRAVEDEREPALKRARARRELQERMKGMRRPNPARAPRTLDLAAWHLAGLVQGKPTVLYHGTTRTFPRFSLDRARHELVNQFYGAGLFFVPKKDTAWKYADANRNVGFDPEIVADVARLKPKAGAFLRQLVEDGNTEANWDRLLADTRAAGFESTETDEYLGADPNTLYDIANYVIGSKSGKPETDEVQDTFAILTGSGSTGAPESVYAMLDDVGLDSERYRPKVYICQVTVHKPLVTASPAKAKKARAQGYDSVVYYGPDLVDAVPEIAVFDPAAVRILGVQVETTKKTEDGETAYVRKAYDGWRRENPIIVRGPWQDYGRTLKGTLWENTAILSDDAGWNDGGCFIAARALAEVTGGELWSIVGAHHKQAELVHHVVVAVPGGYLDGDGFSTKGTLLRRWRKTEKVANAKLEPLDEARVKREGDLVCPPRAVAALKRVLPKPPEKIRRQNPVREPPPGLVELAKRLTREWAPLGVTGVGTGFGLDAVGSEHGTWGLYVVTSSSFREKDSLPESVDGFPVRLRGHVVARRANPARSLDEALAGGKRIRISRELVPEEEYERVRVQVLGPRGGGLGGSGIFAEVLAGQTVYQSSHTGRRFGNDGDFVIENSEAVHGWGPLAYDLAMEKVTELGGTLRPDRKDVSSDARAVWAHYATRPDVEKVARATPPRFEGDHAYRKAPTTLARLRETPASLTEDEPE
jgi:hypothetical protein